MVNVLYKPNVFNAHLKAIFSKWSSMEFDGVHKWSLMESNGKLNEQKTAQFSFLLNQWMYSICDLVFSFGYFDIDFRVALAEKSLYPSDVLIVKFFANQADASFLLSNRCPLEESFLIGLTKLPFLNEEINIMRLAIFFPERSLFKSDLHFSSQKGSRAS
jgi:hypothetical protein